MEPTQFVQHITQGLGLDQKQSRMAIGTVVGFVVQHARPETAKELLTNLPLTHSLLGADRVPPMTADQFEPSEGKEVPHVLSLFGTLDDFGITIDQHYVIIMRLLDFIARTGGEGLARQILAEVPDLDPLDESATSSDLEEAPPSNLDCSLDRDGATCTA